MDDDDDVQAGSWKVREDDEASREVERDTPKREREREEGRDGGRQPCRER
jgi:hypothetical protein